MRHFRSIWLAVTLLALALAPLAARADGRRGFHQKVYAVPAPHKVTIDGKLDDWDLSGQILICVADETAETMSARFAMMYDKNALYVSAVVKDPSPMLNRHDPKIDPQRGWDADMCQIYLTTDPALGYPVSKAIPDGVIPGMMDMYLWNFTDRHEPALACYHGMNWTALHPDWDKNGAIPHEKFQAAYVKDADGQGYTFEYRIPWETLGASKPLKGGDLVAGLVQFNWSDNTGLSTMGGGGWAYDVMGHPGFPWQESSCWGKIIFSPTGKLSRDIVEEGLPPAKPLPLKYGFDLPEESEATIQFFGQDGVLARTLVASGTRHAGHNIESWDGLDAEGKPMAPGKYVVKALYHKPITTKFLFSAHNAGQPPYHTDDGKGTWGGDHGNPSSVCALDDGMVLAWQVCEAGFGIIKTDFNGKKIWGAKHDAADIATDGKRLFVVGDFPNEGMYGAKVFDAKDCRPLNWGNGNLTLDPPPGAPTDSQALAIAYANGKIYVSWTKRNALCMYDATSGSLLATWTIPSPGRLATRPDGSLLVISEGKVLAMNNGQATTLIADHLDLEPDKAEFLYGVPQVPNGITVGADGTIYVANSGKLQNISVFDAQGKYLRSIGKPGGRPARGRYDRDGIYEPGGMALDKLGRIWLAERTDYPKRISVWDAKTGAFANEFFGASSYFGWAYMDALHPDELYCHNVVWKVDWKNNTCTPISTIWRPTAPNEIANITPGGYLGQLRVFTLKDGSQIGHGYGFFQYIYSKRDGDLFKPFAATIEVRRGGIYATGDQYDLFKDAKKWPDARYFWIDKNNDQTIQADEVTTDGAAYYKLIADLYAQTKSDEVKEGRKVTFVGEFNLAKVADDSTEKNPKYSWAYRGGVIWHHAISLPPLRPGDMIGMTTPIEVAGQFTGAMSYFGVFQIVTTDGVYVAQGFRDTRAGGSLGADTVCTEAILGQLVKPAGMDRYFFIGGATDGRVTEVLGLDTVKRLPDGEFTFTDDDAKIAISAQADYKAKLAKSQRLTIARGRKLMDTAKPVGKIIDGQRNFSARAAYDADNLYVSYDVSAPNELTNEITDPHLIFKGGNLLDIQIATDGAADPKRKIPAPGDMRLLVTRQGGKPAAVLFRPRVKGFNGQAIILKSPSGQEPFEAIDAVEVGLTYQKTAAGFHADVTIPLKLLNWMPKPGQQVKIDLGYIFGNAAGNEASLRAYWSNNGFSGGVLHDVPSESRLTPDEWGMATVE